MMRAFRFYGYMRRLGAGRCEALRMAIGNYMARRHYARETRRRTD